MQEAFKKNSQSHYSGSRLSEVQEPHPQPPKRKRGGGYYVPHVIRKRYKSGKHVLKQEQGKVLETACIMPFSRCLNYELRISITNWLCIIS